MSAASYDDDLHGDGERQLVAVASAQLLGHDEDHTADQGEEQRGDVGVGKAAYDIYKSLVGRSEAQGRFITNYRDQTAVFSWRQSSGHSPPEVTYIDYGQGSAVGWHLDPEDVLEN